jgi:hypothetical protein
MKTRAIQEAELAGVGPKLLAHSKLAEFTAKRGLVVELFPFIYGASERMSAKAISHFLEMEQGVKLSSVTINKALKDPARNWNLFFDMIEPSARILEKNQGDKMKDFLFREEYLVKPFENRVVNAVVNVLVPDKVAEAVRILRGKWYVIDWETRRKALPFVEHRLGRK